MSGGYLGGEEGDGAAAAREEEDHTQGFKRLATTCSVFTATLDVRNDLKRVFKYAQQGGSNFHC